MNIPSFLSSCFLFYLRVHFCLIGGVWEDKPNAIVHIRSFFGFWDFFLGKVVRKKWGWDLGVLIMNEENPRLRSDLETRYFCLVAMSLHVSWWYRECERVVRMSMPARGQYAHTSFSQSKLRLGM